MLARSAVDRVSARRADTDWLAAAWAMTATRVLVLENARALVRFGDKEAELVLVPPAEAPEGLRFLLGVDADEVAYFGVIGPPGGLGAGALPPPGTDRAAPEPGLRPADLREAAALLNDRDAGLFTHAVALANWHATHTHCPRCGTPTVTVAAGHAQRCPVDGSEHFPRIDPAVIMLVTDDDDRCLLARNRRWPEAACPSWPASSSRGSPRSRRSPARSGRKPGSPSRLRYVGSQPWPMPQSLMLGFRAVRARAADHGGRRRDRRGALVQPGRAGSAVASGEILLPPPVSIAHRLIESWYGGPLPGTW